MLYNLGGLPLLRRAFGDPYRLDLDVYRLGGIAFARGTALYGHLPLTQLGKPLPFTYPPLAAISFSPMSWMSLSMAGIVMTLISVAALSASILLTLHSLGYDVVIAARRVNPTVLWSAGAVLVVSFVLEPIFSTYDYGQINMVLMALVILDCLPKKTPWPRGLLIGAVAAIKLTPAVFVLYLLVRKDFRASVVAGLSFAACTAVGFLLATTDSTKYWTEVLVDSNRIGKPAYPGDQSLTGVLARLGMDSLRMPVWVLLSAAVLAVAAVGMHRALRADQPALALCVNAMAGLLVSPISWSHHWVWIVPMLLVLGVLAYRRRSVGLATWVSVGVVLFHFAPHWRLAHGRYSGLGWPLWDQFVVSSYVWWGLATIVIVATLTWSDRSSVSDRRRSRAATSS
ncbi:DUF2029 domain-containing protein [Antrihabitans cavernicola]|uniref:DUF2029 domain-containing protein n=2 Tax=Antrihabitans cavernicola TaxID=2495913 RepID=A0A5A7SEQ7_9NOCA|nr:DUF2029 domain-containing protein [Spelaeibacter cavernicola]